MSTSSSIPGCKPYDIAALIPIIETGRRRGDRPSTAGAAEKGGDILAAATPELHAAALAILSRLTQRPRRRSDRASEPG